MKIVHKIFTLLLVAISCQIVKAQVVIPTSKNDKITLNGKWKFKLYKNTDITNDSILSDSKYSNLWEDIKVPGCWELQNFDEPNYGERLADRIGCYVTHFKLDKKWVNNKIFINFDGVAFGYALWINRTFIGSFNGAYLQHNFNISDVVNFTGNNEIILKVSTHPKGWKFDANDDWSLSGIIRDVTIFKTPDQFIKDFLVNTTLKNNKACIKIKTQISDISRSNKDFSFEACLTSPLGEVVGNQKFNLQKITDTIINQEFLLNKFLAWNAEEPYLYNLKLSLNENGKVTQVINQKIGIRELSIENRVIKLNGKPIKFKGVNHHDLSPINGRAISDSEILADLILMKQANINAVRTSHYPPNKKLIEWCDSLGFYVVDEVPFGYGDKYFLDSTYNSVLITRANHTIWRDKNNPSVLVWSIGNENDLSENGLKIARYVKSLDSTRFTCFPTVGSYFSKVKSQYPNDVDLLSPHYPGVNNLNEFATNYNRPFLITEYAHAFGLGFDRLEDIWNTIEKSPAIAGGFVWHFFDQGILRKATKPVNKTRPTTTVWKDSIWYYDAFNDKGPDGIVYADRTPQTDYYEVKKVYSPVKIELNNSSISAGKNTFKLNINNRYDYINLKEHTFKWHLKHNLSTIDSGSFFIDTKAQELSEYPIKFNLDKISKSGFYFLFVEIIDKRGVSIETKHFHLNSSNHDNSKYQFTNNAYSDIISDSSGKISATLKLSNKILFSSIPKLRVGRKKALPMFFTKDDTSEDSININSNSSYWYPHLLNPIITDFKKENDSVYEYSVRYEKGNHSINQYFDGKVKIKISNRNLIHFKYSIQPHKTTGYFLETGVSIELSSNTYSQLKWIGNGPFPSYPGKSILNEIGIYKKHVNDLTFQGNYSNVKLAVLTDSLGNGLLIDNVYPSNIGFEFNEGQLFLNHNTAVSGTYNKKGAPDQKINANKENKIEGEFQLKLIQKPWNDDLKLIFGNEEDNAIPFNPFYHSYDQ